MALRKHPMQPRKLYRSSYKKGSSPYRNYEEERDLTDGLTSWLGLGVSILGIVCFVAGAALYLYRKERLISILFDRFQ